MLDAFEGVEHEVLMPDGRRASARRARLDYEQLLAAGDPDFEFPDLDENARRGHVLHERHDRPAQGRRLLAPLDRPARAGGVPGRRVGVRERDTFMPVVPMFHANAWGMPYAARDGRRPPGAARAAHAPRRRSPS